VVTPSPAGQVTFRQGLRRGTRPGRYNRSPKMTAPQRSAVVVRVGTTKPKKPNSAVRKIAKVTLGDGRSVRAVIPGSGHDLQEHNTVLVRAGRVRDIPGVHYRLVRNKLDLDPPSGFRRQRRRSKFGVSNWAYVFRDATGTATRVVCRLRSRRHALEGEWSLPPSWGRPGRVPRTRVTRRPPRR
jgi:small subunit ribosomal protein S12